MAGIGGRIDWNMQYIAPSPSITRKCANDKICFDLSPKDDFKSLSIPDVSAMQSNKYVAP